MTTSNNMDEAPRETTSDDSAPDTLTLHINPKKIRDVIGKGCLLYTSPSPRDS